MVLAVGVAGAGVGWVLPAPAGCSPGAYFPGAASFLMDRATLLAHRLRWGEKPDPARHDLARLTPEETAVYDDPRFDRHQPRLRLEQERVGFWWLNERLAALLLAG
jgi:hypothetical protein